jgi:cardiolipin synthase
VTSAIGQSSAFDNTASVPDPGSKPVTDRTRGLRDLPATPGRDRAGTSSGVIIRPGSDDGGWIIPPPVRLSDGTYVQLFKDGEAWHAAFEAIGRARFRICMEIYIFASDDTGRAVADLLCRKAREGVAVYLIYDSFGSAYSDPAMFRRLRHAGCHVQEFHPMSPWHCRFGWRPINRDHRKLLVIDDDTGGLGGMNLGHEYAGSWIVKSKLTGTNLAEPAVWRDNAIGVAGPGVRALYESFLKTWNYVGRGGPIRRAELVHDIRFGEFGVLASVPAINSPLKPALCHLFGSAKKSIDLTMAYFAPDDQLVDELCNAAKRGVRVRLMLPGRGDIKLLVVAARSFYQLLMSCGVQIFERQNVVLHAKTMVVDAAVSVIGSTNLDYRSIEYNCELSAVIRSEPLGKQVELLFENDLKYAVAIDPDQWKQRPVFDRFGQWCVSRARYLL